MQIDKQQIVDMLKNRGDSDKATQAQSELPARSTPTRTPAC
jgi:hypothetical protein